MNANLPPDLVLCGSFMPCVPIAYMLCRLFKRLPRLTLSDHGVVLELVFSIQRIHWRSLGAFSDAPVSWRGEGFITAAVTGRSADPASLKRGNILLAARSFAGRHHDFAAELNAWRAQALGNFGIAPGETSAPPGQRQMPPDTRKLSVRRAAKMFGLLWLAMLAGILLPLLADELVLRATGAHIPAGTLGAFMVIGLVAAALTAGYAVALKGVLLGLLDVIFGTLVYLLSVAALLIPSYPNHAKIGLAIVALLPPLCMAFCYWVVARDRRSQGRGS